ncbi:MAG: type II toxin-antitoxin system RelE/ParE family toxin [Gammaproteobacteria bacterium]|nr:type II toxin-antitoxin system RelE/ParE family toxin [Gammaproteobacteria bacterium]
MAWTVELSETARKQLRKLDRRWQAEIVDCLEHRVAQSDNPRQSGKALSGDKKGLWRYRVGDYRLICDIQDSVVTVLVLAIGHRSDVYR